MDRTMKQDVTSPSGWDTRPANLATLAVLRAAALLILARFALLTLGFHRTATIVSRFSRPGTSRLDPDHAQVRECNYVVSMAAALVPARILCLERSLILYHELKRKGMPAALCLGVRAQPFGAHAWVILDGNPINEVPEVLKDFAPIFEVD